MVRLIDGNPRHGMIDARLALDHNAFLAVFELVRIDAGDTPSRLSYSYSLIADDTEIATWEFDPSKDPAHHMDRPGDGHQPSERVSLKDAVEEAWGELATYRSIPRHPEAR